MSKVLVACEFSGRVRESFRELGHDAWSCDILPTEIEGQHYQCDVKEILYNGWDLMIAHPPCTRLCNSGVRWLAERNLWHELEEAITFFLLLKNAPIEKIAIENPIPHKYAVEKIGVYSQIIQPYMFGEPESKATCLWLKNLPLLKPTNILSKPISGKWNNQTPSGQNKLGPSEKRAQNRGRTYWRIAKAMAAQWGNKLC
jgi:hypothetical protein